MNLAADLMAACDPVWFAREALGFDPDAWQARVLRSNRRRLILNCCRQSGKSTTAAILALHRALYYPRSLVLLVSPSLRQSSELFRKVIEHLNRLPDRPHLTEENRLSLAMPNSSRIVSLPGTEGTIRGYSGADLIIEDEAARVPDDLTAAIRPTLAVSQGCLILMSTPFGKRGHFYQEWTEGGDSWERIMIPASACPRISPEFLEDERKSIGDWFFRQEYECEYVDTVDQVFDSDLIRRAIDGNIAPLFPGGI